MNFFSTLVLLLLLHPSMSIRDGNESVLPLVDSRNAHGSNVSLPGGYENATTIPDVNASTLHTNRGTGRTGNIFGTVLSLLDSIIRPNVAVAGGSRNTSTIPDAKASTPNSADDGSNESGDNSGSFRSLLNSINIPGISQNLANIPDSYASLLTTIDGSAKSDDAFGAMLQLEKIIVEEKAKLFRSRGQFSINQQLLFLMGSLGFGQCLTDLNVVIESVKRRKEWAIDMVDSFGKPGTTLTHGNNILLGDFDMCIDAKTGLYFESQYCGVKIGILRVKDITLAKPTGFFIGMCLPSSCGEKQIQDIINAYMWFNPDITGGAVEVECREKDRTLSPKAIVTMCVCLIFLCAVLLGTAYDVFHKILYLLVKEGHDWPELEDPVADGRRSTLPTPSKGYFENQSIIDKEVNRLPKYSEKKTGSVFHPDENCQAVEKLKQIFSSFSAYTNFSNLMSTEHPKGSITCINGLKFFSMLFVVVYHVLYTKGRGIENIQAYFKESYGKWSFMIFLSEPYTVDTFFAIGGILVSYLTLKKLAEKETVLTPGFFGHFYIHRIWRLTPTYMLILMTNVTLLQYLYTGPGWMDDGFEFNQCEKTWWTNLLYINNFVYADEMCMEWTWYLSVDMQFYILSPLLFLPMFYYEWRGLVVPLAFLLGNAICTGVITSVDDLPAFLRVDEITVGKRDFYWTGYYVKPYTRIAPYVIGTITGFLLYKYQRKAQMPKLLVVLGWVVATALALLVVFGPSEHQTDDPLSADVTVLFNSLNRIAWGMSICWVIFACANGYGGIANTFLSWKAFVPLTRLSYCFYLIHPVVIEFGYMSERRLYYMNNIGLMFASIVVTVLSYTICIIPYLIFEAPMVELEKVIKSERKVAEKIYNKP